MEWNAYNNSSRNPEVKAAVEAENGIHAIWLTRNFDGPEVRQAVVQSQCSGVLLEGEIPPENGPGQPNPQAPNWPEIIFQLSGLPIRKGLISNGSPFVHHDGSLFPEIAEPLVADGWAMAPECYLSEAPNATPENVASFYGALGWHTIQPAIGLYGGKTLADYPTRNNYPGWSVWAAEYVF